MGENADTLKKGFEAFSKGDLDAASESWADDIRWEGTNDERLPLGGRVEGKDSIKEALGNLGEHWESFSVTPDEFHDSDDTVIVLGHAEAKAKETGKDAKWPFVHVWRFKDGKATEVLALADTFEIAKTLGVAEGEGSGGADDSDDSRDEDDSDDKDDADDKDDKDDSDDDDDSGDSDDDDDSGASDDEDDSDDKDDSGKDDSDKDDSDE